MRYLLDTHTFIWLDENPDLLSKTVQGVVQNSANNFLLSYASIWEIQIKLNLGKIKFPKPLPQKISDQQNRNDLALLPIELPHIFTLDGLPHHHRDPFDRLLIAQAITEQLPILSNDPLFSRYPVRVVW